LVINVRVRIETKNDIFKSTMHRPNTYHTETITVFERKDMMKFECYDILVNCFHPYHEEKIIRVWK